MFTWIMMIYLRLMSGDPLFIGRLVSVTAGALSMVGIFLVSYELFRSRRISFLASLLYVLSPFTLLYDRLALYDSLVGAFFLWNMYLGIRLVRTPALDTALLYGMTLGLSMLNKSSGFFGLYLLPFTVILFDWKKRPVFRRLLYLMVLSGIAAVISQLIYSILRLSPFFHIIGQKNLVFIYTFREWLSHPFQFVIGNLRGLFDWLITYMTRPLFAAALLPALAFFHRFREKAVLYLWWIIPFTALAFFGRVLYPRFILFMALPLYILAAYTVDWLLRTYGKRYIGIIVSIGVFLPSMYTSYFVLTDPWHAQIPDSDKNQLLNSWPAGGGVREANEFFLRESRKGNVTVYTEGTFGLMPYAVEIYLVDKPNITIRSLWPLPVEIPREIVESGRMNPTYLVTNQLQAKPDWPIELVEEYPKGMLPDNYLRIYRVIAPGEGEKVPEAYL
jgi:4-amino-4-deoxy-L-arabinose transferase-like glycosyltransferase